MKQRLIKLSGIFLVMLVLALISAMPAFAQDKAEVTVQGTQDKTFSLSVSNTGAIKGIAVDIELSGKGVTFDALKDAVHTDAMNRNLKVNGQKARLIVTAKDGLALQEDGTIHLAEIAVKGEKGLSYTVKITEVEYVQSSGYQRTVLKEGSFDVSGDTTLTTGEAEGKKDQEALKLFDVEAQTYQPDGNSFQLMTEGGSGSGAVSYTVDAPSDRAEIQDSVLYVKAAGTYAVYAEKAGDETYNAVQSNTVKVELRQAQTPVEWVQLLEDNGALHIKSSVRPEKVKWNQVELTDIQTVEGEEGLYTVAVPSVEKTNTAEVWISDNYETAVFTEIFGNTPIEPDPTPEETPGNGNDATGSAPENGGGLLGQLVPDSPVQQTESLNPYTGLLGDVQSDSAFAPLAVLVLMVLGCMVFLRRAE